MKSLWLGPAMENSVTPIGLFLCIFIVENVMTTDADLFINVKYRVSCVAEQFCWF
jgi:hypothetical protein